MHGGQLVLDRLHVDQRRAEGLALAHIIDGDSNRRLQHRRRLRRSVEAFLLELLHLIGEAAPLLADAVAHRHTHVVEEDLRRVRRVQAELLQLARDFHALRLHRHDDQRLVPVRLAVRRIGEQAHPVRLHAIGDPHFRTGDDVIVAVAHRAGADRGDVGARAFFRYADAGDHFARDRGRQKFATQFIRTVLGERRRRHVRLHAERGRHAAGERAAPFLGRDHRIGIVEPEPAESLRLADAEKAGGACFPEQFVRGKDACLFPGVGVGIDFRLYELAQRAAEFLVFLSEDHFLSPSSLRGAKRRSNPESRPLFWTASLRPQ